MLQIRERASPHGDAVVCRGWSGLEARRIFSDRATGTEARLAAAAALVAVPDRAALPALVRVLGDTGEETALRIAAVGALEPLGDLAAVPALLAVLASDEGNKRLNDPVAWALPTFGPAALPPLLAALSLARGATNHAFFVLTALGVLGDPRAITPLRAFLADPARAADHAAALDALHALGAAPPDAALAALARDPARGTLLRESAIGALVYPCRPAAVAALLALLDDPVRRSWRAPRSSDWGAAAVRGRSCPSSRGWAIPRGAPARRSSSRSDGSAIRAHSPPCARRRTILTRSSASPCARQRTVQSP